MAGEGGWDEAGAAGFGDRKLKNTLPLYGNRDSMNLNSMILTNILGSAYFKEELIAYKTFHEVVDEIYYKVEHLEPWEKNSRKLAGQVGMCAGVRGVAAGGIVSTAYCLLFKLFTLKLTRKQLTAMLVHKDSPYIRGIGFMYIRYSQPPADFWDWFSPYLEDEEEIDLKAGGGYVVTIGDMCRMMISKLDWFGTLFPRLPVNVQKSIESKLQEFRKTARVAVKGRETNGQVRRKDEDDTAWGEAGRRASLRNSPVRDHSRDRGGRSQSKERRDSRERGRVSPFRRGRSRSRERRRSLSRDRRRPLSRDRRRSPERRPRSRSRDRRRRSRSRERRRSRSRDQVVSRHERDRNFARRSRSRSRDRARRRSRSRGRRGRSRSPPRRR